MSKIEITYKDGKTSFNINASDYELVLALLGLEGYLAAQSGLSADEIRELIDDSKEDAVVKPKEQWCNIY